MSEAIVHRRSCNLCECVCGLTVPVADGKVGTIRGDREDPWSKGYLCPKGTTLGALHEDPDRLRVPMIRDGDQWREATWDEAFLRCEELIGGVLERHGVEAFTAFIGNPTGHNFSLPRYAGMITTAVPYIYSAGTVDQWPKNVSTALMFGNMWLLPAPDLDRTDYFLCMGGNPHASGGSLIGSVDSLKQIKEIQARGGKVVVLDPRRTKTADLADEWIPIQPGTDAAWLLALLHVVFEEGERLGHLADHVDGVETVREACRPFSPERVEAFTRIPAEVTRRIARELLEAKAASVYGRIGLCNQEFGTLASALVDVLAICAGQFDRPGTLMFGEPVAFPLAFLTNSRLMGEPTFGNWRSRVRGAPEVLGQVPASCMAEEIATPGPGQLRGLICIAGNPVISVPESDALDAALADLECMISIDCYLNETSRHAHVIFPGPSPLETPHFDELLRSWACRSVARWSDALFDRLPGSREEWEVLIILGAMLRGAKYADIDVAAIDDEYFSGLCMAKGLDPTQILPLYDHGGPERLCDWSVRVGAFGDRYGANPDGWTLEKIKAEPLGIDLGPNRSRVPEAIVTSSGKIHLAPAYIFDDLARLEARMERPDTGLVLVSRRHMRSKNSWMHNIKVLVKGKDRCTLIIHPDDARKAGVSDGDHATVTSEVGSIDVPVEVSDEMLPGVVCLPHGWGHDKVGTRLSVAREHAGVNNNRIAPGRFVDEISGNAAVNGIPVEVTRAAVSASV
jgi:anaerobic selenocysteine-containing dehydrogenase